MVRPLALFCYRAAVRPHQGGKFGEDKNVFVHYFKGPFSRANREERIKFVVVFHCEALCLAPELGDLVLDYVSFGNLFFNSL